MQNIINNLTSAPLLFLILGIVGGRLNTGLKIPKSMAQYLSIILLVAIGYKGGHELAQISSFNKQILSTLVMGLAFSLLQPLLAFIFIRRQPFSLETRATIAAQYGSVSLVTFLSAINYLQIVNIPYQNFIIAVLALMEVPAIISGFMIIHRTNTKKKFSLKILAAIICNRAVFLLVGAFIIGMLAPTTASEDRLLKFLDQQFYGIMCLYMLDMGLTVAHQFRAMQNFNLKLAAFGIYMPLLSSVFGLGAAHLLGLDLGTATLFIVLVASASYIAVPTAMRMAYSSVQASIFLPLSIGITFLFNVSLGIPLYFSMAQSLLQYR